MDEKNKTEYFFSGLKSRIRLFFVQEYFQSRIAVWLMALGLVANLADWLIIKIFIKPVDFPVILHYNVYFGVDMVGNWRQVYFLPSIGVALFLINFILAAHFYGKKERIASYLLLIASLMIQLSLIVATTNIAIINY